MRGAALLGLVCLMSCACHAANDVEGRWQGEVRVPGRPLAVVVDLAPQRESAWAGSIIVAGLRIKGAPLSHLVVNPTGVSFDLGSALTAPNYGPTTFDLHWSADGRLEGDMRQADNVAHVSLHRTGTAQVEMPMRSTAVLRDLENQWVGEFELGGYPRNVTLTLTNHADAAASAQFIVVGKQRTELPIDLVVQEGDWLTFESPSFQARFEGRFVAAANQISGMLELGPLEIPLVLRRSSKAEP